MNERELETQVEELLGYLVTTRSMEQCTEEVASWVTQGTKARYFACLNPHAIETAKEDLTYRFALQRANLLLPDGIGIVLASLLLGGELRERVTGPDLFQSVTAKLNSRGRTRCFFLGGSQEGLWKIRNRLEREYPNICFGGYSPPYRAHFSNEESLAMLSAVNEAEADVLWVGMTAPKQEKWISQHLDVIQSPAVGAIGAAFDFFAGTVPRPSRVYQRWGLEWLPRLLREPSRLWYRSVISTPCFMKDVVRARFLGPSKR